MKPKKKFMTIKTGESFVLSPSKDGLQIYLELRNIGETAVHVQNTEEEIIFAIIKKKQNKEV